MFRPAGLSDSDDFDDFGFGESTSRRRNRFSETRGASYGGASRIDWNSVNANSEAVDHEMKDEKDQKILDRTKKYIRAVLISSKGLKDIHELSRDYYESCEESIPYQRLGFSSLHSFLQSIPSVCRVIEMGHSVYVEGVADKDTRHIKQMISAQKKPSGRKKKGGGGGGFYLPPVMPSRPSSKFSSHSRSSVNNNHVSAGGGVRSAMNSIVKCASSPQVKDPGVLLEITKKYIRSVLSNCQNGQEMSLDQLELDYATLTNEKIPFGPLGFSSLSEFLMSDPSFCKVTNNWGKFYISLVDAPPTKVTGDHADVGKSEKKVLKSSNNNNSVESSRSSNPLSPIPKLTEFLSKREVTSDIELVMSRLTEMLKGRVFGLMVSSVGKMYQRKYDQSLPDTWIQEAEKKDFVFETPENSPHLMVKYCVKVMNNNQENPEKCESQTNEDDLGKLVQRQVEKLSVEDIISSVDKKLDSHSLPDIVLEEMRSILEPRKFGLFKRKAEKLFEEKTGKKFEENWWAALVEGGFVSLTLVVKWVK